MRGRAWRHRAVGFQTAELQETPLDGLRAGRDRGRGGFKLMGGLCHSARRFLLWESRRRWCTQRISASSRACARFAARQGRARCPWVQFRFRQDVLVRRVGHRAPGERQKARVFPLTIATLRPPLCSGPGGASPARVSCIAAQGPPSICMRRPSRSWGAWENSSLAQQRKIEERIYTRV